LGNFLATENIGIACSRMFSDMYHRTVNDTQLLWRVSQRGCATCRWR